MLDSRIKLRHLRCFLETAQRGSLSAAADRLNVSQPAASKTIRELEDILGTPLFDRSARRLVLTASGRLLHEHGGSAIQALTRAQDLVRGAPTQARRLLVGVLPTAATDLMPRACLAFRSQFPDTSLRVSTGPNWLLMSQLRETRLDLVVGRMGSAEVMSGLSFHPLFSEKITAVVRPGHPLLDAKDPLADLASYPLIVPPPGAVIANTVQAFLARKAIAAHGAAYETVSLAFGRKIVQTSDAVWFISEGVVRDETRNKSLVQLNLKDVLRGPPVGVSMRATDDFGDAQQGLITALQVACKDHAAHAETQ